MPRIFTNNAGLPTPLFLALKGDTRVRKSDISVTELLKSPQQLALEKRYEDKIVEDVSDRVWAVCGQAMHSVIEKAAAKDKNGISEQYITFPIIGPKKTWTVGGLIDYIGEEPDGSWSITDWKFVSVWSYIFEKHNGYVKPEYQDQLNVYAAAPRRMGLGDIVKRIKIGYIFRDWKKGDLGRAIDAGKEYPSSQIMIVDVPVWSAQKQDEFIHERVMVHQLAQELPDAKLPECSKEERWERGEAWAVYKGTNKTASRVFDSPEEAAGYIGADKALRIVHRPGKATKCLEYCPVSEFCKQHEKAMAGVAVNA